MISILCSDFLKIRLPHHVRSSDTLWDHDLGLSPAITTCLACAWPWVNNEPLQALLFVSVKMVVLNNSHL